MLIELKAFKGQTESIEIMRQLKRYQGNEFAEVFDQDVGVLKKMTEIFDVINDLIQERLGKKISEMFADKSKIEDEF